MDNSGAKETSCYICNKQRYTLIFYERGYDYSVNKELFEITDEKFLQKMQQDYYLKYSTDAKTGKRMTTPLILGSIIKDNNVGHASIHNKISNMTFNRRLRMIRADLHALLSISINSDFF